MAADLKNQEEYNQESNHYIIYLIKYIFISEINLEK